MTIPFISNGKQDVEIEKINAERVQNLDAIDRANKLIGNLNKLTS